MNKDPRNPGLKQGDIVSGYRVERVIHVEQLQMFFYELLHLQTSARHIHLSSDDDNNFFMVTFRTIPQDSTGVAHILEHGILEGSRRFPVKIYKHLTGRSLNSFLNAMTSADYTAFPFASRNVKDYFNLLDLYLDATLFPLLQKEMFLQEGWRYEFERSSDASSPLIYKGVVYNEMKGSMGNPLRQFFEHAKRSVFPDLVYRHCSGGDPAVLPDLSYEEWVAFHHRHYSPSNAYFFTYGTIPLDTTLQFIDEKVLREFDGAEIPDPIPMQKNFREPQKVRVTYPISQEDDPEGKCIVSVSWKLAKVTDFYENLKLSLLNLILAGDNSSVLSRTLLSSGLGGALAPAGFDNSFVETTFGCGLKDTHEDRVPQIEELIMKTLADSSENGFSDVEIEAALHQFEFYTREIKGDRGVPFGFTLALRGLPLWIHGGDFIDSLSVDRYLEQLRRDCRSPGFFENLIRKYLIQNMHRVTLIMVPEKGGTERIEKELREKLEGIQKNLSDSQKQQIIDGAADLLEHQNRKEDTSCLPEIDRSDIPLDTDNYPQELHTMSGRKVHAHNYQTNGISYLSLIYSHSNYIADPGLVDTFLSALTDLGAAGRSYSEMGKLINLYTGGIHFRSLPFRPVGEQTTGVMMIITSKSLQRNQTRMLSLISDICRHPDTEDPKRFAELVGNHRAYVLPMAAYEGHRMAMLAAGRHFSKIKLHQHHVDGLGHIRRLIETPDQDIPALYRNTLQHLWRLTDPSRLHVGCTCRENEMGSFLKAISEWISHEIEWKPDGREVINPPSDQPGSSLREAWIINTEISFVAQAFQAVPYHHPDAPVLQVLSQLMETPLYDQIRAKGGAYGAFSSFDSESGVFLMMTYRDPHTVQSIQAFQSIIHEIGSGRFTDQELEQAIIETIRNLDVPMSPRERGITALINTLIGKTYEKRLAFRQGVLNVGRADILRISGTYFSSDRPSAVSIVTSDEILKRPETRKLDFQRIPLIGKMA